MMKFFQMEQGTFRAKRTFARSPKLQAQINSDFGSITVKDSIKVPSGVDPNEWLAVHTIDYYNQTNAIYGKLVTYCTNETCPVMNAGPKYQYLWADGETIMKPIKCSAPEYIDHLMNWIQSKLDNAEIFPQTKNALYSHDFRDVVKTIFKRIFRVYSHCYYHHFKTLEKMKFDTYLNLSFKHFIFFSEEFGLIDEKEMKPLTLLIESFKKKEEELEKKPDLMKFIDENSEPQEVTPILLPDPPRKQSLAHSFEFQGFNDSSGSSAKSSLKRVTQELKTLMNSPLQAYDHSLPPIPQKARTSVSTHNSGNTSSFDEVRSFKTNSIDRLSFAPQEFHLNNEDLTNFPSPPPPLISLSASSEEKWKNPIFPESHDEHDDVNGSSTSGYGDHYDHNRDMIPEEDNQSEPDDLSIGAVEEQPKDLKKSRTIEDFGVGIVDNGFWTMSTYGTVGKEGLLKGFVPNVIIIGNGMLAEHQILNARASGYNVEALYSHDGLGAEIAQKMDIPIFTSDLNRFFAVEADAIIVAEGYGRQFGDDFLDLLRGAKAKGKMICLSPLSLSLPKRKEAFEIFGDKDDGCMIMNFFRCLPCIHKIREAVVGGKCGSILSLSIILQDSWKRTIAECYNSDHNSMEDKGHTLMTYILSQLIDVVSWVCDRRKIDKVFSTFVGNEYNSEINSDKCTLQMLLAEDLPVCLNVSLDEAMTKLNLRIDVTGSEGSLVLVNNKLSFNDLTGEQTELLNDESVETTFKLPLQLLSSANLHFYQVLKTELLKTVLNQHNDELSLQDLKTPLREGFKTMRIVEAIRRQRMVNLSQYSSVNDLLKQSPKTLRNVKDSESYYNTQGTQESHETESLNIGTPEFSYLNDMPEETPVPPPRRSVPSMYHRKNSYESEMEPIPEDRVLHVDTISSNNPTFSTPIQGGWFDSDLL